MTIFVQYISDLKSILANFGSQWSFVHAFVFGKSPTFLSVATNAHLDNKITDSPLPYSMTEMEWRRPLIELGFNNHWNILYVANILLQAISCCSICHLSAASKAKSLVDTCRPLKGYRNE